MGKGRMVPGQQEQHEKRHRKSTCGGGREEGAPLQVQGGQWRRRRQRGPWSPLGLLGLVVWKAGFPEAV